MSPPSRQAVDLANCDKEPIHIPGSIQPHGMLFALHEPDLLISQVSANVAEVLGLPPEQLLGAPLQQVLESPSLGHVVEALRSDRPQENNPLPIMVGARSFEGIVHRHQGATLLELEPERIGTEEEGPLARSLLRAIARLQASPNGRELFATAVREVRALTGFDRVMLYRFDEEERGRPLDIAAVERQRARGRCQSEAACHRDGPGPTGSPRAERSRGSG